jgi:hypothetical protein
LKEGQKEEETGEDCGEEGRADEKEQKIELKEGKNEEETGEDRGEDEEEQKFEVLRFACPPLLSRLQR